jgi:phospholipid transport system substrate-binding protein
MKWLYCLIAVLYAAIATAQEVPPDTMIKSVSEEVLNIVRKDADIQSGNSKKAVALVEAKVLPHFDFARMTRLAMGRDWRQASPAQQQTLTEEFRIMLVRTYSKALTQYRNQGIDCKPGNIKVGDDEVKVRTTIREPGGKPIELDYYLEKQSAEWKVFDIEIDGISLVTNYRDSFAQEIRTGGIEGLVKSLQTRNSRTENVASQ